MAGSVNFAVLGMQEIASGFGKKGTSTDITLYDRKESGTIRTWVAPSGFPDKIQPLLAAINLAEYVVFHVDRLDRFAGEQIIALEALDKRRGILSHTYDVDESRLESMIRGTVVEGYARADQDGIVEAMGGLGQVTGGGDGGGGGGDGEGGEPGEPGEPGTQGPPVVLVDHSFDVKGVGTVVLGKVAAGRVRQYDTLRLFPGGAEILVKSIQMHDDPVQEAARPARVGLAVKGARHDEIGRGDVISADGGTVRAGTEIEIDFRKSPFYKSGIGQGQGCLVSIGLQVRAARIGPAATPPDTQDPAAAPGAPLRLSFERPVAYRRGEIAVVLKPESPTTRIAGSGRIRE